MSSGGSTTTVGYRYYLGMHMVCTMGPVDKVSSIKVDKKTAWIGSSSGGSITINAPDLFGGDASEGGVSGRVDFLPGGPSQGLNSYLSNALGDPLVPNFRGVSSFVLNQCYLGINPYLKPWSFRLQRIHLRQDGITQWYDAKAQISTAIDGFPSTMLIPDTQIPSSAAGAPGNVGNVHITGLEKTDLIKITLLGPNGVYPAGSAFEFDTDNGGHTWGASFTVNENDSGTPGTTIGSVTNVGGVLYPTEAIAAANLKGQSFSFTGYSSYTIWIQGSPVHSRGGDSCSVEINRGLCDMNPAHILRECLTDPDWGMGYNEADVDDTSFMNCADALFDEGLGMSLLWDTQTDIGDFITTVLNHIDACIYVDRRIGKFVMKLIRDDYVLADLLELTENDIDHVENFKRPQFGELTTAVTVQYWESLTNTAGSVTIQDIALEAMQEAVISTTQAYPGFTNAAIANRVAQRDLRTLSAQIASCTVFTDRTAKDLQIGDVFLMTWPDYELTRVPMRITGVAYGDGKSNRIRLTVSEDVFSLDAVAFIPKPAPVWVDPHGPPVSATTRIAFEFPYLELVQQQTEATTDSSLSIDPQLGFIGVAVARPTSGSINLNIWADAGSGYTNNAAGDFCPIAKLTNGIDKMQTSFSIQNGDELDLVTLGSWVQVDDELMGVTALSSSSITVTRAALDTLPALHSPLAVMYFWDKFPSGDPTQYEDSESINIKLTPRTGSGTLDLAAAPVDVVVLAHRAIRPYPPANLKINGLYFPTQVEGDLVLTWAHRDRTQQTGGTLLSFTDGSVGPETGVTYTLKVYNTANALVRTVSGITGTTTTYTGAMESADGGPFSAFRFTLAAVRAGFQSWQVYDVSLTRPAPIPVVGIFIPDTDITAKDPNVVAWNDNYFIVGIQGKIDSIQTQGLYRIPDTSAVPEYLGQLYDGRTYTSGAVPAPYEGTGALMNLRQTPGTLDIVPLHANGVDSKYSIYYGRRDASLAANFRWLLAGDNSTGALKNIDTVAAINNDIMAMLRTSGGNTFAWAIDVSSGLAMKCWKSTDGGNVWSYQGLCTNWSAFGGGNINGMNKVFQVGTKFVNVGFSNSKVNTASDGIAWVDHDIVGIGSLSTYKIADVAYDGTALVAIGQVVSNPLYETHVLADSPVSLIDYYAHSGTSDIFNDKVDTTRLLRTVPNGVGITGWGLSFASALAVSPNAIEPGSLLIGDTGGLGIGAIQTVTGSYLESRTGGNAAINFLQGTTDFSIECWVGTGVTVPAANLECVLFSQCRAGTPQFQNVLLTFKTTTNVLRLRTIRQTGVSTYATDVDLSVALGFNIFSFAATHIVVTRGTGGRIFFYINGAQVGTVASGPITNLTVTGTSQLGCVWGNTNSRINCITGAATPSYSMAIDAAALYTTELNSTRVLDHYNTALADGLTRNRVWRSTDGATWTQVRDVTMDADLNFSGIGYYLKWDHIVKLSTGFAIYGREPFGGFSSHVVKSTDHGATWGSNTALITSVGVSATQHIHVHSSGSRILATLTTRTVSGAPYAQFAYSTDGITFTDIDSTTFPPGSKGVSLITLDDTAQPRIAETGEFRIMEN